MSGQPATDRETRGAVILANAVVIGLETEEAQQDEWKAQEERGGGGENSME